MKGTCLTCTGIVSGTDPSRQCRKAQMGLAVAQFASSNFVVSFPQTSLPGQGSRAKSSQA